ncbi:ribosomal protein L7/L12 [Streptomyces pharetrae]|uniref:ribosomal protein bL12 n=1 Tax=Streptomyces pharetrae TaxID=291370 RepID=UPI00335D5D23
MGSGISGWPCGCLGRGEPRTLMVVSHGSDQVGFRDCRYSNEMERSVIEETPDEQDEFAVLLESAGSGETAVVKVVRELIGLDLREAREVEIVPKAIKDGVPRSAAEDCKKQLVNVGATVSVERVADVGRRCARQQKPLLVRLAVEAGRTATDPAPAAGGGRLGRTAAG